MSKIDINSIRAFLLNDYLFGNCTNFFFIPIGYDKNNQIHESNYSRSLEKIGALNSGFCLFGTDERPSEKDLMNSIEEFVEIIQNDESCLNYVSDLISVLKHTLHAKESLLVEEKTVLFILKHFWQVKEKEVGGHFALHAYRFEDKDKKDKKLILSKEYPEYEKFRADTEPAGKRTTFDDYILLIDNFLQGGRTYAEKEEYRKESVTRYLYHIKNMRNVKAHRYNELNPGDIVCLCQLKLFTLIATVFFMRKAVGSTYGEKEVDLTFFNSSRQVVTIKLFDKENGKKLFETSIEPSQNKKCSILRYHRYDVQITSSCNVEIKPEYKLTPTVTYTGTGLDFNQQKDEAISKNITLLSQLLESIEKSNKNIEESNKRIGDNSAEALQKISTLIDSFNKGVLIIDNRLELITNLLKEDSQAVRGYLKEIFQQLDRQQSSDQAIINLLNKLIQIHEQKDQNDKEWHDQILTIVLPLFDTFEKRQAEQVKKTDPKKEFWCRHIPVYIALALAAFGCLMHCINTYTIFWMLYKKWYLLAFLVPIILSAYLWYVHKTTKDKAILTSKAKLMGWGGIALATLLWCVAILATPRPSEEQYIANFSSWNQKNPNILANIIKFHEQYLDKHPDSEIARMHLAEYYLNYTDDVDKALEITSPMKDVVKYPLGCSWAAETFYRAGKKDHKMYSDVNLILKDYKRIHHDSLLFNLNRIEALMMIQGLASTANPQEGIQRLYDLSQRADADYAELYYDLGYWTSHDVYSGSTPDASNDSRSFDLKWVYYDLAKSVRYLRKAAYMRFPKAAVELGNLYSDLNIVDSAKYYYDLAINQAGGNLRNEALFKKGLLLESQGMADNESLREARNNDYLPAILHMALKEKDHITAINYYDKAQYDGYRYIPPVVFEYLQAEEQKGYEGLRDSALVLLQREHPECHFNKEFIEMMEYIIGTPRVSKNMEKAKDLSIRSANKGCIYAKMMNLYTECAHRLKNGLNIPASGLDSLFSIARVIPFAQVLACDLEIKTGRYLTAMVDAQYPIAKEHPAATMILSQVPPSFYELHSDSIDTHVITLANFYFTQKILRISPYKEPWAYNGYILNENRSRFIGIDYYMADGTGTQSFWANVLAASHNFRGKILAAFNEYIKRPNQDTTVVNNLVLSALADLDNNSSQDAWDAAIFEYGFVTSYEQTRRSDNEDLRKRVDDFIARFQQQEKRKNNYFSVDGLFSKKEQAPDIEKIFLELQQKQITPIIQIHAISLLDECSSLMENFNFPYL